MTKRDLMRALADLHERGLAVDQSADADPEPADPYPEGSLPAGSSHSTAAEDPEPEMEEARRAWPYLTEAARRTIVRAKKKDPER